MTTATPITEAFEAKYQRSAEDPTSADMLAIFSEGWNARGTIKRNLMVAEALMPKADIRIDAFGETTASDRRPFVMGDFYTADQLHEAIRAATERAAVLCDERATAYRTTRAPGWHEVDHECTQCAAAIRASGGMGAES